MSFISKIILGIAVISLPVLAMDQPNDDDWWGAMIKGSPTIKTKAKAINNH